MSDAVPGIHISTVELSREDYTKIVAEYTERFPVRQVMPLLPFALIAPHALAFRCGYGVEWSALHTAWGGAIR